MKNTHLYPILVASIYFGFSALGATEDVPSGTLLELHDCELIAGGCIASSESTLGGRSLLRVWDFKNGAHEGQKLAGLKVALLQVARENLAFSTTSPSGSIIYLPQEATPAQQKALTEWLLAENPALSNGNVEERIVPIEFAGEGEAVSIKVGQNITLQTQAVEPCGPTHCSGTLWYSPRSPMNSFEVLLNRKSTVREKSLKLTWNNYYAKSVFFGSFGEIANQYASYNSGD